MQAIEWHRFVSFHKHMPADGGLADQDSILLDALTVLAAEAQAVESALIRERSKNGR